MKYVVNKLSVVLLDQDKKRGYSTVAYDHKTDKLMSIRPKEYSILKYISDSDGLSSENIESMVLKLHIDAKEAEIIVSDLFNKGILETGD
ncbi:MAG: hypothetical protein US18_C0004G0018 [Parcubacteria group bacterium GW2011_GWB1_36_5]|nr:MAG: hypothetical protein US18_C0004G0018 [Parcubacteria group bacterium GW2011_GWB1_36_5]